MIVGHRKDVLLIAPFNTQRQFTLEIKLMENTRGGLLIFGMTESIQVITALSLVYTCIEFEFVMIFKPFRHVYVLYFTTYDCAVE